MITAILFVVMLLVLVIPHELGHMIVAKMCGVQVNEFSVGMGPLILQRKKGETMYSIRLLPLGGYCKMEGEDEESENPRAFNNKKPAQKIAILLAGVAMNVILAILIVFGVLMSSGVPMTTLDKVTEGLPAHEAGLRDGDRIAAVDGEKVRMWSDFTLALDSYHDGDTLEVTAIRNGGRRDFYIVPQLDETRGAYYIGVVAKVTKNPIYVMPYAVKYTKQLNTTLLRAFGMLFTGKLSKDEVSGPVGMVRAVDQTRTYGITSYLLLLAIISLNLAIFNILPFPALDGGRIVFVIIRMITGKAISDELEGTVHVIGMLILLGVFVFVTINDVINLL